MRAAVQWKSQQCSHSGFSIILGISTGKISLRKGDYARAFQPSSSRVNPFFARKTITCRYVNLTEGVVNIHNLYAFYHYFSSKIFRMISEIEWQQNILLIAACPRQDAFLTKNGEIVFQRTLDDVRTPFRYDHVFGPCRSLSGAFFASIQMIVAGIKLLLIQNTCPDVELRCQKRLL